ncbi:hypothetical protein FW778_03395 [Ginsengibacter hankyongi]|uniref:Uncharacterized protein n=1 Tax=Ginsengibacter hankyongi TaxID=2607284 RepID=A0A5J5IJ84_9BACT|nr:hypothetical protein [Ginsengibacter hankyongi]KAA9041099.1 hypothetical protein FW778_03395 [Ginsengibacter hankyongi]
MKNNLGDDRLSSYETMQQKKISQLQIEVNTWKRLLNFFKEENVYLKNRLSDILKDGFDRKFLDEFENFQTKFIKQDEVISLLRNDTAELDKLLDGDLNAGIIDESVDKKLAHLRNNMANYERQFFQLQLNFNTYLAEKMC